MFNSKGAASRRKVGDKARWAFPSPVPDQGCDLLLCCSARLCSPSEGQWGAQGPFLASGYLSAPELITPAQSSKNSRLQGPPALKPPKPLFQEKGILELLQRHGNVAEEGMERSSRLCLSLIAAGSGYTTLVRLALRRVLFHHHAIELYAPQSFPKHRAYF